MNLVKKLFGLAILMAMPLYAFAQNITVSGVVKDASGLAVIGASVIQQGTSNGVVTDLDGNYSISVPSNSTLTFSSIGFADKAVAVAGQTRINVVMEEDNEILEEVVVIGYGVQKKSDVTGAIASVGEEAFGNRSVDNVAAAFAGKTSGVQVIASSGDPSSIGTIRIRGISSNSSDSSDPLYLVDGLQVSSLDAIDPQNVKSIEILKDAASAAIYGAQAGNGVVVITTKTGEKGKGQVFYNGSYTIQKLGYHPNMMNAEQYIEFMTTAGQIPQSEIDTYWDGKTDNDWFKSMFPGGYTHRHTLGVKGGTDKSSYYSSISFLKNDGIFYGTQDVFSRLNFQLNADHKINDWLKVGTTNTFQTSQSTDRISSWGGASNGGNSSDGSVMAMVMCIDPLTPTVYSPDSVLPDYLQKDIDAGRSILTDEYGNYISAINLSQKLQNPLVGVYKYKDSLRKNINLNGTLYANITPFKGFTFTSRFGYRVNSSETSNYQEPWYSTNAQQSLTYSLTERVGWGVRYQWENFINYTHTFAKKHQLDAMAGMSYIESNSTYAYGSTDKLDSYESQFRYLDYSSSDAQDSVSGSRSRSAALSYFARLGYSYNSRYYIQASFRADAFDTSKLSPKNRWGYFPSVSLGWTVTNEPWMKNVDKSILSFLKLRASWGINGNVNVLSGYQYASTVSVGASQYQMYAGDSSFTPSSYPSKLSNDKLGWESSSQVDFGIDARFFKNRLTFGLDLYNKNTNDLLVSVTPSYTTGQSSVYMNSGSVNNKGIEVEFGWKDVVGDFSYNISGNLAHNSNMVTYLDPTITYINGAFINNNHYGTRFEVGHPVWYMCGYKYTGLDDEGVPQFEDLNGDGAIDTGDLTEIGSAQPDLTFGLTFSAEWKNFDFTVFGSGSVGNNIWFCGIRSDQPRNLPSAFYTESFTKTGDKNSRYPAFAYATNLMYSCSSALVFDGSYFRINQIQLGYTLPKKWLDTIHFSKIRVYASLDDFFTFSKYIGFDPSVAGDNTGLARGIDRGTYPTSKRIMFGLNLSF